MADNTDAGADDLGQPSLGLHRFCTAEAGQTHHREHRAGHNTSLNCGQIGAQRHSAHGQRGNKVVKAEIAMIKVAVPAMACKVIDWAIQAHGGGGTSNDFGLAHAYAMARVLRLADGPDEVHRQQLGRMELKKYR